LAKFPTTIVLAGGLASRLGSLAKDKPKAMIEVAEEPFIAHQLRLLRREGVSEVVICVGHLAEEIERFVGNGSAFGLKVSYSHDGELPLGTGGAVRKALSLVDEAFAVIYGDTYLDIDFAPVYETFRQSGKQGLMTVLANQNHWDCSNVLFVGGEIKRYSKTDKSPDMHYIDYGLSIFSKSVFQTIPENTLIDLATIFANLVDKKQLAGYEVSKRFYEIGTPAGLAETTEYLSSRNC